MLEVAVENFWKAENALNWTISASKRECGDKAKQSPGNDMCEDIVDNDRPELCIHTCQMSILNILGSTNFMPRDILNI